jgi:hypothetical protein
MTEKSKPITGLNKVSRPKISLQKSLKKMKETCKPILVQKTRKTNRKSQQVFL